MLYFLDKNVASPDREQSLHLDGSNPRFAGKRTSSHSVCALNFNTRRHDACYGILRTFLELKKSYWLVVTACYVSTLRSF